MSILIDCSAIVGAWLDDEPNTLALRLLAEAAVRPVHAPTLLPLEFANALLMAERRGRVDPLLRVEALDQFRQIAITIDGQKMRDSLHAISDLAQRYNLLVYDAAYLELALRLALPLATLDSRLATAARANGAVVVPGDI